MNIQLYSEQLGQFQTITTYPVQVRHLAAQALAQLASELRHNETHEVQIPPTAPVFEYKNQLYLVKNK